jgi:hypothetical protein
VVVEPLIQAIHHPAALVAAEEEQGLVFPRWPVLMASAAAEVAAERHRALVQP